MPEQKRTEQATPHRRQEARRRGQVFRSQDVSACAVLTAVLAGAAAGLPSFVRRAEQCATDWLSSVGTTRWTLDSAPQLMHGAMADAAALVAAPFALAVAASVLANGLQVGFVASMHPLAPQWERVSPSAGFKRMFSRRTLFVAAQSVLKAAVIGWVAFTAWRDAAPTMTMLGALPPDRMAATFSGLALGLGWRVAAAAAILAALDFLMQRSEFERTLRMTRQELRDEHRQTEGDPHVRARQRERQRRLSRQRLTAAVKSSDVVVTNPEHLAVALQYREETMRAPRVMAKGGDAMARRIRALATQFGIPILERRDVARALFAGVEVGQEVPKQLYEPVAHVVAWLYDQREAR